MIYQHRNSSTCNDFQLSGKIVQGLYFFLPLYHALKCHTECVVILNLTHCNTVGTAMLCAIKNIEECQHG